MDAPNTNTDQQHTPDAPTPKAKKTRAKRETYTIGQLAVMRAKEKGIDSSRAAKEIRGRLRANFDAVVKMQPSVGKAKSAANDGNRWPAISTTVVRELKLAKVK